MSKLNATIVAVATLSIFVVWWTWTDRAPTVDKAPLATRVAQTKSERRLPGRTYLNAAQLSQAYRTGELDRPIKSLLSIDKRLEHGGYHWDDAGIPKGPTWIRVDLNSQMLSVFRAGHEIGTSVILYGSQSKQTPAGVYPILAKAKTHRSSLYDADMPFTLRLTDDGISIHGSNVRWGAATHGCIGVPVPFAEKMFDTVASNDEVVVLRKAAKQAAGRNS